MPGNLRRNARDRTRLDGMQILTDPQTDPESIRTIGLGKRGKGESRHAKRPCGSRAGDETLISP